MTLRRRGCDQDDYLIEFAAIPFDSSGQTLEESLAWETLIHCPSFEQLRPRLADWVLENNRELIEKAHQRGISLEQFRQKLADYLTSPAIEEYFGGGKIVLFGKSVASIDIPFLKRDLGQDWFEKHFIHRQLDLSSVAYHLIDGGFLPQKCASGSELSTFLGMGEVAHTALADARNTAKMYLQLLKKFSSPAKSA